MKKQEGIEFLGRRGSLQIVRPPWTENEEPAVSTAGFSISSQPFLRSAKSPEDSRVGISLEYFYRL